MRRPVATLSPLSSVRTGIIALAEYGYAGVPVVDEGNRLLGMLTSGDVLRAEVGGTQTVGEVMTTPAVAAAVSQDLDGVARMLLKPGVRSVPVVDEDKRVVGIISRGDVLRMMIRPDDAIAANVQTSLDAYGTRRRWKADVSDSSVTITGSFKDESERRIAMALARIVPGVRAVSLIDGAEQPEMALGKA
ncbi:MAG: CBS domain-containing protein [Mycobacterium sp.]|nr:CBS domain-containing protein [Mycobacterium sp.]